MKVTLGANSECSLSKRGAALCFFLGIIVCNESVKLFFGDIE
jgi:hypothetical protein